MGYDYRTAVRGSAGSIAPLTGPATTCSTRSRRSPTASRRASSSWASRTTGGPGRRRPSKPRREDPDRREVRLVDLGHLRQRRRRSPRSTAGATTRREASAWIAYKRRNCTAAYGCVTTWREVYYDDAQSLRAKYDMINRYGLRGAGIWALGYDDTRPELYRVIVAKFLHDTTPPETGIDVLAPRQGDEGFVGQLVGARHEPDPELRRPGLGRRRALAGVAGRRRRRPRRSGSGRTATPTPSGRGRPTRRAIAAAGTSRACRARARPSTRAASPTVRTASLTIRSRPDTSGPAIAPAEPAATSSR